MEQGEGGEEPDDVLSDEALLEQIRVAYALPADWVPPALPLADPDRQRLEHNLRVAKRIKEKRR